MDSIVIDPFPSADDLNKLWLEAWSTPPSHDFQNILSRSLAHIGAYVDQGLVGFVNVAWDGGVHAFILDTGVSPRLRRQGIATRMIQEARQAARDRGAVWLHVDFEPHLISFYRGCGFAPTEAGLVRLRW
ncbi:GNAT family N-acetyltransferase [Rhizobium sp. XQZ8]|uniref:GNAT family N-acetyltransferase n=1 Tax=Rhizobium populisoli TaxID=2859785 RepID=UPI001C6651CC|nr:GNAT family N-acetyltransferase [Rhizobium populisoli]MBW6425236.1 GNAT family N-acetyltransferase [Rhizobium populisoli]